MPTLRGKGGVVAESRPRVALVQISPPDEAVDDTAIDLWARPVNLQAVGAPLGVEVSAIEASDLERLEPGAPEVAEAFRDARAIWWLGRLTFPTEARRIVASVHRHLEALGRTDVPVVDDPDAVDEAFSAARFYPLLKEASVPQAETAIVPLALDACQGDESALAASLRARLEADPAVRALLEGGAVFFRTYYGTLKIAGALHCAFDKDDLAEGAARLVVALRAKQEIGGLAIRRALSIAQTILRRGRLRLRREYRIFIVSGRPVYWLYNCEYGELLEHGQPRPELVEAARSRRRRSRRSARSLRASRSRCASASSSSTWRSSATGA